MLFTLVIAIAVPLSSSAEDVVKGTTTFEPTDVATTPERFRLKSTTFPFEMQLKYDLPYANVDVFDVRCGHEKLLRRKAELESQKTQMKTEGKDDARIAG